MEYSLDAPYMCTLDMTNRSSFLGLRLCELCSSLVQSEPDFICGDRRPPSYLEPHHLDQVLAEVVLVRERHPFERVF